MAKEKCTECKGTLVLDEENLCAYCELKLGPNDGNTPSVGNKLSVDCGICKVIVEEDSEGLFCDVCNTWFHNDCNETPLSYDLYALLNEAPNNVKWFCDRCIWETEKWITQVNNKQKNSIGVRKVKKIINELSNETRRESGLNIALNEQLGGEGHEEVNVGFTEGHRDNHNPKIPEIKLEIHHEEHDEYLDCEDTHNSVDSDEWIPTDQKEEVIKDKQKKKRKTYMESEEKHNSEDSDEWIPTEEKEEVIKVKPKKKRKNKTSLRIDGEKTSEISEEVLTENMSNILDISQENLSNIIVELCTIQKFKYKRSKCNLCPKAFLHLEDCIAHKLNVHEGVEKPYKCPVCKITFETKNMRIRHMEKHDDTIKLKCDICSKKLKNHASLQSHLKLFHIEGKLHSCTECDFTSKYKTIVTQHMINEHSIETKFQCKICSKYFVSKRRLISHLNVHNPDKQFSCEVCNKKFSSARLRQRHIQRQHATEKPFECTECGKKYAEEKMLNQHIRSHIPNEERLHACDECELRFNNITHLKKHKEIHAGVSKVICDICGKGLRDPYYLKRHMMMHNDERPLKCEICGKGFRHSGHLDLHIKYHKKIVTASCPICGFGAPTKYVLNRHIKLVHTNETPFECDTCGNKYKTKGNLSKHKRGIRGSCKGFNSSDSSIQDKREPKTSGRSYYEQDESKQEVSPIHFQESYSSTAFTPAMQNHENHPPLLLYANSHNTNVYLTQYQGSLIPPNSRGITATIPNFTH